MIPCRIAGAALLVRILGILGHLNVPIFAIFAIFGVGPSQLIEMVVDDQKKG
jgi:hypothetical protein